MKRQFLIFLIILIFCTALSVNLYSWKYYTDMNKVKTGLNSEIEELREIIKDNPEALDKLEDIENYIDFQQTLFLGDTKRWSEDELLSN